VYLFNVHKKSVFIVKSVKWLAPELSKFLNNTDCSSNLNYVKYNQLQCTRNERNAFSFIEQLLKAEEKSESSHQITRIMRV